MEEAKNISCAKGEDALDHSAVTRWFKKFCLGCKIFNDQARLLVGFYGISTFVGYLTTNPFLDK